MEMDWSRRIVHHPHFNEVKLLEGFKHLSTIDVVYRYIDNFSASLKSMDNDQVMAEAVGILKKSQRKWVKYARIRFIEADSVLKGHTIRTDTVEVSEVWGD
jgi:hypothetical protein